MLTAAVAQSGFMDDVVCLYTLRQQAVNRILKVTRQGAIRCLTIAFVYCCENSYRNFRNVIYIVFLSS